MRYTIITPTIGRETLERCKESVCKQTIPCQHLVGLDEPRHDDCGNWVRHTLYPYVEGDYVMYLDDDNYLAHDHVLEDLLVVDAAWALVPILREGQLFYHDPPEYSKVDTGNMLIRRELAVWPDTDLYEADWILCQRLLKHPYQRLPEIKPVMIMERSNHGR